MRIAVIDREKCKWKKCGLVCVNVCPVNRTGKECIVFDGEKVVINEELCIGCGICVKKCPFQAITIVNLPEAVGEPVHQYGPNGFRLFGLPSVPGSGVFGLLGRNGTGKSTAVKILAGIIIPNFGRGKGEKEMVLERFRGKEMYNYFRELYGGEKKVVYKVQEVEGVRRAFRGTVREFLEKAGGKEEYVKVFGLEHLLEREVSVLSGGELQRLLMAAVLSKEADLTILDEPSSFLDIKQRVNMARAVKEFSEKRPVMVVEHDLSILDYLSDYIFILFGKPSAYGIVSGKKGVRRGINEFLDGYLREENMRIREFPLEFHGGTEEFGGKTLFSYPSFSVRLGDFSLEAEGGEVREGEVVGIVGENGIGKTTFVRVLAGEIEVERVEYEGEISYKPQYVEFEEGKTVGEVLEGIDWDFYRAHLRSLLDVERIMEKEAARLSGGERQKVAIVKCLATEADVYLLDEPSSFLDVEGRVDAAVAIKRTVEKRGKVAFVVDHDLLFVDYVSSRLVVFTGEPGRRGRASGVMGKREGMNLFLKSLGITFRRDPESGRPRVNKEGSQKDVEQKKKGEYYYA